MAAAKKDPVGKVMVVGAGIAGVQAALDLANAGFYVHLVEKKSAIGGVMAQLDKTFPTNDCSMCIISPKLVECGRHLNIDILPLSEVKGITGEPGNFTVTVAREPRYIDPAKCTGCGACTEVCPVRVPTISTWVSVKARPFTVSTPRPFPPPLPSRRWTGPPACGPVRRI